MVSYPLNSFMLVSADNLDFKSTELPFKRLHSSLTPHTSPGKPFELLSPVRKKEQRMRTGIKIEQLATTSSQHITLTGHFTDLQKPNLKLLQTNKQSMTERTNIYYLYILLTLTRNDLENIMVSLQSYVSLASKIIKPECSNIIYCRVLQQRCDDKETLLYIINDLYTEFFVTKKKNTYFLKAIKPHIKNFKALRRSMLKTFLGCHPFLEIGIYS